MRLHLLILVLIGGASLSAQSIKVAPSTLVATGSAEHPIVEPHLAVDPMHPDRLLAAAFARANPRLKFPEGQDDQICAAFLSLDSGGSWTRHDFNVSWCADPWVAMTPDGQTLVTMVGKHAALAQQGSSGLVAFHSIDNGRTWDSLPIGLGRNHDHPTMAVDFSPGSHRGWIYLSSHRGRNADDGRYRYGVHIARSRNGGRSFDDPVYVIPNNLHNLAEMPVVVTDGIPFESFVDATFTPDSGGTQAREVLFDRRRAWVTRSSDGGFVFSAPFFVTDACGPPPSYRLSAFAADLSRGPYDGRLYFACQVSDRGAVLVAWMGPSGNSDDHCGNLYASVSTNGGTTFSSGVLVASCAGGGEYFGITAVPGGRFRLLWPETRDGVQQLRTAALDVTP